MTPQQRNILTRRKRDKIAEWGNPKLQEDISDLQSQLQDAEDERDAHAEVLNQLRYWFLDTLIHNRPMDPTPRRMLRIIEDVLK